MASLSANWLAFPKEIRKEPYWAGSMGNLMEHWMVSLSVDSKAVCWVGLLDTKTAALKADWRVLLLAASMDAKRAAQSAYWLAGHLEPCI